MSAGRGGYFSASSSSTDNPSSQQSRHLNTELPPFTYDELVQMAERDHKQLYQEDKEFLRDWMEQNPNCIKFSKLIKDLKELESAKTIGIGLSQKEKEHYHELNTILMRNETTRTDTLHDVRLKLIRVKEVMPQVTEYRNIIVYNQAYYEILNKHAVHRSSRDGKLLHDWRLQKDFAAVTSSELIMLNKVHNTIRTTLCGFSSIIKELQKKLPANVCLIIQYYCTYVQQILKTIQMTLIASMVARLQVADVERDIEYDDIIQYTVARLEEHKKRCLIKENASQKEVFAKLRSRRRRGMTHDCYRQFVKIIQDYIRSVDQRDQGQVEFSARVQNEIRELSCFNLPHEFIHSANASAYDPVFLFVTHHFEGLKNDVLDESNNSSMAIAKLTQLQQLILIFEEDAHLGESFDFSSLQSFIQGVGGQVVKWGALVGSTVKHLIGNASDEGAKKVVAAKLSEIKDAFVNRVNDVGLHLLSEFHRLANTAIKESQQGKFDSVAKLVSATNNLLAFLNEFEKWIDNQSFTIVCDLNLIVLEVVQSQPEMISIEANCENLAKLICLCRYWPMQSASTSEFEEAITLVYRRLSLMGHIKHQQSYDEQVARLFYLEEPLRLMDYSNKRFKWLAKTNHADWIEYIPFIEHTTKYGLRIVVPNHLAPSLTSKALDNIRSDRRSFLVANGERMRDLNELGSYILNVVIRYFKLSPFISLVHVWDRAKFVTLMRDLDLLTKELIQRVDDALSLPRLSDHAIDFFNQFKQHLQTKYEEVRMVWESVWFARLQQMSMSEAIQNLLSHDEEIIDIEILKRLIAKIDSNFTVPEYRQALYEMIIPVCIQIISVKGVSILDAQLDEQAFRYYLRQVDRLMQMESVGSSIRARLNEDTAIRERIIAWIKQSNGDNATIGTFITMLFPVEVIAGSTALSEYIIPYASKRLETILSSSGQAIEYGDKYFFDMYRGVDEFDQLIQLYQERVGVIMLDAVNDSSKSWQLSIAKLIELFGSIETVSAYRSRCMMELLLVDDVTSDDYDKFMNLQQSSYRTNVPLVCESEVSLLQSAIDHREWTPAREAVISTYRPEAAALYHERCFYLFLNNQAPLFGAWLQDALEKQHPEAIFGRDKTEQISQYVQSLIDHAEKTCRDINMTAAEGESLLCLIANLKILKPFYEKIDHSIGIQFIQHVNDIEDSVKLGMKIQSTLRRYANMEYMGQLDEQGLVKVVMNVVQVLSDVERQQIISTLTVRAYLELVQAVVDIIPSVASKFEADEVIDALVNLFIHLTEHLKSLVLKLVNANEIQSTRPELFFAIANCIQSTVNYESSQRHILDALEEYPAVKLIAVSIFNLARLLNQKREDFQGALERRILHSAHMSEISENPVKYLMVCVSHLVKMKGVSELDRCCVNYVAHVMRRTLSTLSAEQFNVFRKQFIRCMDDIRLIQSRIAPTASADLFSMWADPKADADSELQKLLSRFERLSIHHAKDSAPSQRSFNLRSLFNAH